MRVLIVVTSLATLMALLTPSAAADDPSPVDTTITFGPPTVIQGTMTVSSQTTDIVGGTVTSGQAGSQCVPLTAGSFCLGTTGSTLVTVQGAAGTVHGTDPALKWIFDEAVDFLAGMYDVPKDDRLGAYAEPEIRAYVANRVLDIVTKEAYGKPLTANEQMTLDWLNNRLTTQQLTLAQAAYDEWQKYSAAPCAYSPPTAPSWVTQPRGLPGNVFSYCHMHPGLAVYSLPPMPSADDFRAWGTYRAASGSGLQYAEPGQSITPGELSAYLAMAGTAAAIAAGAGAAGLAQLSTSVAQFGVDALGLGLQVVHAATWEIPYVWVEMSAVGAGAIGLAGLVAGIITALVNVALFSWQFAENMKVGPELAQAVATASSNTDPLGLQSLKAQNAGKTFPDGSTPYLDSGLPLQLLAMMGSTVGVGAEVTEPWSESAHTAEDLRFKVGVDPADQISVPKSDGSRSTVWFSKKWMIEQTHDMAGNPTGTRAILGLQYVNNDGKVDIAYRAGDEFQIATVNPDDGTLSGARVGPMDFKQADGTRVQVGVTGGTAPALGGPRPSAAGKLVVGTGVNLRPNPVSDQGDFDLGDFVDGYTYTWNVARLQGSGWVDVPFDDRALGSNPTYGAFFMPSQAGQYRATVTLTKNGTATHKLGTVTFTVAPPILTAASAQLVDTGGNQVKVALATTMNTPLDRSVKIDVQWPGDLADPDAPRPTTSVTVTCHQVDAFSCMTADSETNEFGDALKHTLTSTSRLRDGVKVTVTDVNGTAQWSQDLWFDTALRPSFALPPVGPVGQVGSLQFDPYLSTLTIPVGVDDNNPNFKIATIVPGSVGASTVSIVNPNTWIPSTAAAVDLFPGTDPKKGRYLASVLKEGDAWVLELYARTQLDDVGTYTVPLTIQQDDGKRATLYLTINAVVAPDQLFRGAVVSDVDPNSIGVAKLPSIGSVVTGGEAAWDDYAGQLCVSLSGEDSQTPHKCGPVADMVGTADNPVRFPYEELFPHGVSGGRHVASAWLPASSRTWDVPISTTFILASDPPDVAGLGWDGHKLRATVTPGTTRSSNQAVPIKSVSCTIDGAALDPCFAADGGELTPVGLSVGPHEFVVEAVDQADNYDIERFGFQAGLTSITVAPPTGTVRVGRTLTMSATGHFTDSVDRPLTSQVRWTSSKPGVAKVDPASGVVTGVKAGKATITVRSGDLTGTATITVKPAPLATMPSSWIKKWSAKTGPVKSAKVGKQIKVTKPVFSAAGKKQHLSVGYQWYAGGKAVRGATKAAFKVKSTVKGKKITITVTVSKAGYHPKAKTLGFGKAR